MVTLDVLAMEIILSLSKTEKVNFYGGKIIYFSV